MKGSPLFKFTITKGGQQATQYKKIIDAPPVFCADKGYRFNDNVICINTELLEAAFLPTYLDPTLWSSTYHVQLEVFDPLAAANAQGVHVMRTEMQQKSHISTQMFRSKYYWITTRSLDSSYKNGQNSPPTRSL